MKEVWHGHDRGRCMIFSDIQRVFVKDSEHEEVIGVLSLSDTARKRSGSCKACRMARLEMLPSG